MSFLAGTLVEYSFEKTSFGVISTGLDNYGLPKLSSNKLRLYFFSHNTDMS
jgi:hypothetical protein